jgi:hypothetical protein
MEQQNDRRASATPSDDFYTTTGAPGHSQSKSNGHVIQPQDTAQDTAGNDSGEDNDSGSDMDVSDASSTTSSTEPEMNGPNRAGAKRKLSDAVPEKEHATNGVDEPQKKRRISATTNGGLSSIARCPPELWQQVFVLSSPAVLARCLRVSKTFNHYLTNLKASPAKKNAPKVRVLDSEVVWMNSRKNTYTTFPRPLQGFTELEMLQLVGCQTCQTCGKLPTEKPPATGPYNSGPGENSVRVIWPFHLRICGSCFRNNALTVGLHVTY